MSRWNISLGTIPILRQHFFGLFLTPAPTHYVSINPVLNVSKNCHFPNLPTQSFCWHNIRMVPYVVAKKLISWQVVLFLFLPFYNGTKIFFNFLKPLQNTARSRDILSQGVRTHGLVLGPKIFEICTQILHGFLEIHWFFIDFTCR